MERVDKHSIGKLQYGLEFLVPKKGSDIEVTVWSKSSEVIDEKNARVHSSRLRFEENIENEIVPKLQVHGAIWLNHKPLSCTSNL